MAPLLRTVAIVGAGFSGTLVARNLLRGPLTGPTRILLIERSGTFARGVAYAEREHPYLLNVPAARMSASGEDPLEFLKFAQRRNPSTLGEDFLPRTLYGEYLTELLLAAELAAPRHLRLERVHDDVQAVERPGRTAALQLLLAASASTRRLVRVTRVLAREAESLGGDWREAVTFVRKVAPTLWQRLPENERRRFLRHVRTYWDVHRHRLPPDVVTHLQTLRRDGTLTVHAGRLREMTPRADGVLVTWRPRGEETNKALRFDRVINCTGPDYDMRQARDPLLRSLALSGLAVPDAHGLGFRTGRHGALIDSEGWPALHLYYVGPMLRAEHWEATGATELREHAERLAAHLSQQTSDEPRG